jgi:methionyl-tRNA formyltransferase
MRIVVLGTGPFAVPMFRALIRSEHKILGLITKTTPPAKGREKHSLNPMRDAAESAGLSVFTPHSANSDECLALLADLTPDLLVVCDYGQILAPQILAASKRGGVNLHASLLPKYRGAAPIQWALYHGDVETGVSVIHMTPRLDGGPILEVRETAIGPDETHPELEQRLAELGVEPVLEAIRTLSNWDGSSALGRLQDSALVTKAPRLKKDHGSVDWSRSAEQLRNQVRALKPWPGTFTFWNRPGQEPLRLVIDGVSVFGLGVRAGARSADLAYRPGEVVVSDSKQLIVATGDGGLSIAAIAPAGKRHMSVAEFLRGYRLSEGQLLGPQA